MGYNTTGTFNTILQSSTFVSLRLESISQAEVHL